MGLPNAGGQTHRKRATVAPARLSAGGDGTVKAELKEAKKVLKDLMGRQVAWLFNKPVDVTKYPQYYEVISHPMDLGTIRKKLEGGEYEDLDAFTSDLRLVWHNCYTFNRDDQPNDPNSVTSMARELEHRSEELLKQIPQVLERERAEKLDKETDAAKDLKKQLREMQKAQLLQQELMMKQMQQMQQQMMMGGMAPLGANDLSKAVKIIQDNNPSLASGDGHIEVDINALDNPTLWRLWDYLEKCNGPKPKKSGGGGKRGSAANSLLSNIDAASMRNPHQLQQDQRQQAQRQRDEQRLREREERERQRQGAGIDMMGQQKAMTEADQWGGDGFDEYGLGGF
ncbi:bromodomain containing protein [Chrysochromulina tobinii]|uniref:Bromodomain containing protein n=1 Tax=Chrysochromulina tobinii TaxID=1460289 RepID=A0A0M0JNZ0_9EUKA|nr:bromodomain containing protein [Chrysochromulina tobinii]|eukprot:KOO28314.1 bromodomain containing protein [Chrysochromulina sp. CCMP291]